MVSYTRIGHRRITGGKYHGSGVLDKIIDGVGKAAPVLTGLTGLSRNIANKGIEVHQARKLIQLQTKKEKIDQEYANKRRDIDDKAEEERRKKEYEYELEKRKKEEDYDRKLKEIDLEIKRAMLDKLKPKSKKKYKAKMENSETEDYSETLKENDPKAYKEIERVIKEKSAVPAIMPAPRADGYGGYMKKNWCWFIHSE